MKFEILQPKKHNRNSFDCGVEALNLYLQKVANQDQKRSLTKVYVLAEGERVIGYYSISAHSVRKDHLPEDRQFGGYHEIPFLLLGRLAVDRDFQGLGYGDMLILHVFSTTMEAAEKVGIIGMVVDAKDENAASFYQGFGFKRLSSTKNRLVLPLLALAKLIHGKGEQIQGS